MLIHLLILLDFYTVTWNILHALQSYGRIVTLFSTENICIFPIYQIKYIFRAMVTYFRDLQLNTLHNFLIG